MDILRERFPCFLGMFSFWKKNAPIYEPAGLLLTSLRPLESWRSQACQASRHRHGPNPLALALLPRRRLAPQPQPEIRLALALAAQTAPPRERRRSRRSPVREWVAVRALQGVTSPAASFARLGRRSARARRRLLELAPPLVLRRRNPRARRSLSGRRRSPRAGRSILELAPPLVLRPAQLRPHALKLGDPGL